MPSKKKDRERAEALLGETEETLDALLGGPRLREGQVQQIPVEDLQPSPLQPRVEMGDSDLEELADSIRQSGLIEPLIVRPAKGGKYEIIAGERRWRAAQLAELEEVPCLVREVDDTEAQIIALMENIHRRDLSEYERGRALRALKVKLGWAWEQIGERVGLSKRSVLRLVRFAELPEEVERELGDAGTVRHYEAIALLHGKPQQQIALARLIREKGLSGPQARRAAQALARGEAKKPETAVRQAIEGEKRPRRKKEVAELVDQIMQMGIRLRGLTRADMTRTQRRALIEALEGFRQWLGEVVEELRREERG